LSLFFYFLYLYRLGEIKFKHLLALLPIFQVLWVNLHLFFAFGPLLVVFFAIDSWVFQKNLKEVKRYFLLLAVLGIASLINPFFINGALIPLTIFGNFGYRLAENQSIIFLQTRFSEIMYLYFEAVVFLILQIIFFATSRSKLKKNLIYYILFIFFALLAFKVSRGLALFGFFFIPTAAVIVSSFLKDKLKIDLNKLNLAIVIFVLIFPFLISGVRKGAYGVGTMPNIQASADFFLTNNIQRFLIPNS